MFYNATHVISAGQDNRCHRQRRMNAMKMFPIIFGEVTFVSTLLGSCKLSGKVEKSLFGELDTSASPCLSISRDQFAGLTPDAI